MDGTTAPELRVHITRSPSDEAIRVLEKNLDRSIVVSCGPEELPASTDVLVDGRPSRERLAACPGLRAIIVPYAGIPAPTRCLLLDGFPHLGIHNLHHNAPAAAELAIALLLAAAKTLVPADRALRRNDWRTRYDGAPALILEGKTALVLGFGAIGSRVAKICLGFGMCVHAVRRRLDLPSPDDVAVHPPDALHALLSRADVLLIGLPLTPKTEGLIGERELDLLRPSSILVNIARGAIVDEEALFRALSEHRLGAAGIDVWYRYPSTPEERDSTAPSRFPFGELDNVVMSPHRGGAYRTAELEEQRMRSLAVSLNAAARGEPIPHPVDLVQGY